MTLLTMKDIQNKIRRETYEECANIMRDETLKEDRPDTCYASIRSINRIRKLAKKL